MPRGIFFLHLPEIRCFGIYFLKKYNIFLDNTDIREYFNKI